MNKDQITKAEIKKTCDILRRDDGVGPSAYVEQLSWLLFLKVFEEVEKYLKDLKKAEGKRYQHIIKPEYKWSAWATKDWKDKDELIHYINQKLMPYLQELKGTPEKEKIGDIFRELGGNKIRSPHTILDVADILDKIQMEDFHDTHLLSQVYEEILQKMGNENGWAGEFYTPRPIIRLMIKIIDPKLYETVLDPFAGSSGFLVECYNYIKENNPDIGIKEWEFLQKKTFYAKEKKPLPYLIGTMNMILHGILVPNMMRTNTLSEDVHDVPASEKVNIILTNPPFGGQEHNSVQENYPIQTAATEGLALQYVMRHLKKSGRCGIIMPEGKILFSGGAFERIREEFLNKCNVHTIISLPQGAFSGVGAGIKTNLLFFDKKGPTKEIWFGEVETKLTKKQNIKDKHLEDIFNRWKEKKESKLSWRLTYDELKENHYNLSPRNPYINSIDDAKTSDELIHELMETNKQIAQNLNLLKQHLSKKAS